MKPGAVPAPQISVLMPVYNAARYVREAVASVLSQDHPSFELLILDDASTDRTWKQVLIYARDPRVRLFRRRLNRGEAVRRNELLRLARGAYIVNLDADDVMVPGRLRSQAGFLDRHPGTGVVFGRLISYDPTAVPFLYMKPPTPATRSGKGFLIGAHHASAMVRKRAYMATAGYDESFEVMADIDMWLKLDEVTTFAYQDRAAFLYRANLRGLTVARRKKVVMHFEKAFRNAAHRRAYDGLKRMRLSVMGLDLRIVSNSQALLDSVGRWLYRSRAAAGRKERSAHTLEMYEVHDLEGLYRHVPFKRFRDDTTDETYLSPEGRFYYRSRERGIVIGSDRAARRSTAYVLSATTMDEDTLVEKLILSPLVYFTASHGRYFLHASAVERAGQALVLAGGSFSGKTTLALLLVERGWRILSDETVAFEARGNGARVLAYPRKVQVKDFAVGRVPSLAARRSRLEPTSFGKRLVSVDEVWPGRRADSAALGALVFLRYAPVRRAQLRPAGPSELQGLLARDPNFYETFGRDLASHADYVLLLRSLARRGSVHECRYSDDCAPEALTLLERLNDGVRRNGP